MAIAVTLNHSSGAELWQWGGTIAVALIRPHRKSTVFNPFWFFKKGFRWLAHISPVNLSFWKDSSHAENWRVHAGAR